MRNPGSVFFVACTFSILAAEPRAAEPDAALRTDYKYAWPREDQLVLDGPWQLASTDVPEQVALPENLEDLDWFNAELPTEVHWALYRAGKAGHPYVGRNAPGMRWVEDKAWWFRKRSSCGSGCSPASLRPIWRSSPARGTAIRAAGRRRPFDRQLREALYICPGPPTFAPHRDFSARVA